MKQIRLFCMMITCLLLLSVLCFPVTAEQTGFLAEEIDADTYNRLKNTHELTLCEDEPFLKGKITNYDIAENGNVAVSFYAFPWSFGYVMVYSPVGEFLYGYKISSSDSFLVECIGNDIGLYYTSRNDSLYLYDQTGILKSIQRVPFENETNQTYRVVLAENKKELHGIAYEHSSFPLSFVQSKIKAVDQNGKECVIYSAGAMVLFQNLIAIAILPVFIACVVIVFVIAIKKNFKRKREI